MNGHRNKLSFAATGMAMLLLSCLTTLFACSNDDFLEESNGPDKTMSDIRFGVASANDALTRSASAPQHSRSFVMRSKDSADTLFVRTEVTDDIYLGSEEEAITRGMQIRNADHFNANYGTTGFHVLAYWNKDNQPVGQFYMDDVVTSNSGVYSSTKNYYWPGDNHSLQFRAWVPKNAFSSTPATPESTTLGYTVPAEALKQADIMVASTDPVAGDNNQAVPLTFKHISTAVRFEVGSQIQPGVIKTIKVKNVKDSGTYDMATETWTLDDSTTNFTLTPDKTTTGNEPQGSTIVTDGNTLMMLPQDLADDAEIELVFTNDKGQDRTLTASLAGTAWEMGKTVTYRLAVYDLEFLTEPEIQDAHYVVYPIHIKTGKVNGGWTLTSDNPDNVTFVEKFAIGEIKRLVDAGYWLDDYKGTSTLKSTTESDDLEIYMFLKENVTDANRNIKLSLKPTIGNHKPEELEVTQYCPAWNGNMGTERIEDGDYIWGFKWDQTNKVTYSMPQNLANGWRHILLALFDNRPYLEMSGLVLLNNWKITIDYSKLPALTVGTSDTDGQTNTWDIYNFNGINEATNLISQIESWGGVPNKVLPPTASDFASKACAMKNKYTVKIETNNGQNLYMPVLAKSDMVWYLPAKDEAPNMTGNLSGNYWTSTAKTVPGTTAYKYAAGGATSDEDRNSVLHVRAVRKK